MLGSAVTVSSVLSVTSVLIEWEKSANAAEL